MPGMGLLPRPRSADRPEPAQKRLYTVHCSREAALALRAQALAEEQLRGEHERVFVQDICSDVILRGLKARQEELRLQHEVPAEHL